MKKDINFKAHTPYEPAGGQPTAIKEVNRYQTTGNGKICTIA